MDNNVIHDVNIEIQLAIFTLRKIRFFSDCKQLNLSTKKMLNHLIQHGVSSENSEKILFEKAGNYTIEEANIDDILHYLIE